MALTAVSLSSIFLNVFLIISVVALLFDRYRKQKRINDLIAELGSDSLEHYLNEIRKRGFEFTLKPRKKL